MLSGGSPCPVVEHTNTTRGSEIKSAFFSPPEETQKHRSSACVWCYGGRRLPLPASTHHIVGVQGRHPHLQLPPLGLAPDPLGRVLGRARLAAVQHQKAWQRHDGWLGERRSKVTTCQILLFYLIFGWSLRTHVVVFLIIKGEDPNLFVKNKNVSPLSIMSNQ